MKDSDEETDSKREFSDLEVTGILMIIFSILLFIFGVPYLEGPSRTAWAVIAAKAIRSFSEPFVIGGFILFAAGKVIGAIKERP